MRKLIALIGTLALLTGLYSIAPIKEDSASFNCLLHGNHICNTQNYLGFIPTVKD